MPDYSYLKKKVEEEKAEKDKRFEEGIERYYDEEESKMIDYFTKKIKEDIEGSVYQFYKGKQNGKVGKRGIFHKEYYYSTVINVQVSPGYSGIIYPESLDISGFCFPDEKCMNSFVEKANAELNKDKIRVSINKSNYPCIGSICFLVYAELDNL